jgi:hypothetical protein
MFATQLVNRADALFDGSRQPVTPRLIGITEDLLRHDSLNRCHLIILPSSSARGPGANQVSRLYRYTFVISPSLEMPGAMRLPCDDQSDHP